MTMKKRTIFKTSVIKRKTYGAFLNLDLDEKLKKKQHEY